MASTDALIAPVKASAFRLPMGPFFDTSGNIITGWTSADSEISKDAGSYADCTNEATEIGSSGTGYLDLTSTETNTDSFWIKTTISNSNSVPFVAYFVTQRAGAYLISNALQIGGQTASASGTVTFPSSIGTSTLTQTQVTGGAYALNNASFAFNAALDFTTAQKAATLARVTLVDTLTTYTGNTPQTGDSFARIGSTGSGLTSLASATNLSTAQGTLTKLETFIQSAGGGLYQYTVGGLALAPTGGSAPTADQNAAALLKYDWTTVTGEADYSALQALRFLRNVWNTTETPGTLTVKKENGTTNAWTRPIDTDPTAEPITGVE